MDDSQSSDIFSQSQISMNLQDTSTFDEESYELLFTKIKTAACKKYNENCKLSEQFNIILKDCNSCIYQSFDLILSLLDTNVEIERICSYIENAVCILQILSNYIKNVIENMAIECHMMKNFPISTGNIILLVFSHCKDSECTYGSHLHDVEKQLKDLFRSCHELQLTYLMALGKLFIFDLTSKEEQDIFIEALDINLKIGEIAQALDIKTMAEQWKAYTMICEKYSNFLLDKDIYNNCTKLLASTIENNLKTALEAGEEDKVVMRSLKVANFSLKILLRMTSIFKDASSVKYDHTVELLNNISLCGSNYYEITANKSVEFSKLLNAHLSVAVDALAKQLVNDERFLKAVFSIKVRDSKNEKFLTNIVVLILIIKAAIHKKDLPSKTKQNLIDNVFSLMPHCHIWFNMDIKFKNLNECFGLYEQLLVHTIALAASMTCNEYQNLEKYLYEAILGTDYYSAVFSTDIWISLCRIGNPQLQFNILQNLLRIYEKLENHPLFSNSPQEINLSCTVEIFFKSLKYPERIQIFKQFNPQERKNFGIWCALKIRNLPENIQITTEKFLIEKLIKSFEGMSNQNESKGVDNLIKYMKLTSTCSFNESYSDLEDLILKCWCKACPDCSYINIEKYINIGSAGHFKFIESLANLTDSYMQNFENNSSYIKIQHVISRILLTKNNELTTLLFRTFCMLFACQRECQNNVDTEILINTLKAYTMENDLQKYLFNIIVSHEDIKSFLIPILKDSSLAHIKNNFMEYKNKLQDPIQRKNELASVSELKFSHKCLESHLESKIEKITRTKSNFDIDIDSFFEVESEPAHKKAKFDTNIENLISNLENDVLLLSQAKESILSNDHKNRIKSVCDNLRNIL